MRELPLDKRESSNVKIVFSHDFLCRPRTIVTVHIISVMAPKIWCQNPPVQNLQKFHHCSSLFAGRGHYSQQFLDFTHFRRDCLGPWLLDQMSVYFQYCDMMISVKLLLERIHSRFTHIQNVNFVKVDTKLI